MDMQGTPKTIKTLFVNIHPRPDWTKEKTMIDFPIGLCYVVSETKRAGYDFDLIDLRVEYKTDEEVAMFARKGKYDVVAMGGLSHNYSLIKSLTTKIKEDLPEALIVVGGTVVTAMPEKFLSWTKVDIGVIGEGEYTFVEILRRLEQGKSLQGVLGIAYKQDGKIIVEDPKPPLMNLDDKKRPLWELFDVEAYIKSSWNYINERFVSVTDYRPFPIITSRGCPFRCTFCSNSYYYKYNPIRRYSPGYVIDSMQKLNKMFGVNYFWFWDELTYPSKKIAEPYVDAFIKADMGFMMEVIVRVGFLKKGDEAFALRMKKMGVAQMNAALESGSHVILKAMNKRIVIDEFSMQKKILDAVDIKCGNCIVLGYPQETKETLDETFKVLCENKSYPSVGFLLPAPGSVMYNSAIEHGFIKDEENYLLTIGERQSMRINMTQMANDEFTGHVLEHLKKLRDICGIDVDDDHLIANTVFQDKK